MNFLIDMNLPPAWISIFEKEGRKAVHWSNVGDPRAPGHEIFEWAAKKGFVVFTHDLDFGTLLALTQAHGPSVIQVRTQDIMPSSLGPKLVAVIRQYEDILVKGALLTIDETNQRLRILPLS